MINVSNTYNSIISGGGRYEWKITNGNLTIDESHLMGGTQYTTAFEELSVGNAIASRLDLQLWDTQGISPDYPLQLYFRAVNDSSQSAWYSRGVFLIDTIKSSPYSEITNVTAYDAMLKGEVVFMKTGTWSATTDAAIISLIASDLGVSVNSSLQTILTNDPLPFDNAPNIGENGTTDREMLSIIGAMRGWNFIIDHAGELAINQPFAVPANTVDIGSSVKSFDASPAETVSKVKVWLNGTTYFRKPDLDNDGVTDEDFEELSGLCLDVDCPVMGSQDVADRLYTLANNYVNQPYTAQGAYVDPKYYYDGIEIKDVVTVMANQAMAIDALAPSDLSIKGEEIINSYYPYIDPIKKEIERAEAEVSYISVQQGSIQAAVSSLSDGLDAETANRIAYELNNDSNIRDIASSLNDITKEGGDLDGIRTDIVTLDGSVSFITSIANANNQYINQQTHYLNWDGVNAVLKVGDLDANVHTEMRSNAFAVVKNNADVLLADETGVKATAFIASSYIQAGNFRWVDEGANGYSLI